MRPCDVGGQQARRCHNMLLQADAAHLASPTLLDGEMHRAELYCARRPPALNSQQYTNTGRRPYARVMPNGT